MLAFNIRGRDVHCNPVIMAYAAVYMDKTVLYTDIDRLDDCIDKLIEAGVEVKPYNDIYEDIRSIAGHKVLIDKRGLIQDYIFMLRTMIR